MAQEVVFFGHIVIDTVVKGAKRWRSLGGTVVYGALTALRYGARPSIVSKVGEDIPDEYVIFLSRSGVGVSNVKVVRGARTTRFKLVYTDSERKLFLQARGEDIREADVEAVDLARKVAVVGPVIGEVSLEALRAIRSKAALTALDLQGYLRSARLGSPVVLVKSEVASKALELADVVHVDAEEASVLTGLEPLQAATLLAKMGPKAVLVTMGREGAYVTCEGKLLFTPPAEPEQVVDETGTGDVFLTVFSLEYSRGFPPEEAAAMAAAAASLRVERHGFDGLRDRRTIRSRAQRLRDLIRKVEPVEQAA